MKVLVGCEASGVVRDAFRDRGHDALSCDLRPSAVGGPHYRGNVLDIIADGWDLFIAHPECIYLCSSGMHWTVRGKRDPALTESALDFVRQLMAAPVPRIAIENPVGCISTRIRKPDQIVQPYNFGEDASKATCLWLKGLPLLVGTSYVEPRIVGGRKRWANQGDGGQSRLGPSADRSRLRSVTFRGIAQAMAAQWSVWLSSHRPEDGGGSVEIDH